MKLAFEAPTRLLSNLNGFGDFDFISTGRVFTDKEYTEYYAASDNLKLVYIPMPIPDGMSMPNVKKAFELVKGDYILGPYKECVATFGAEKTIGVLVGKTPQQMLRGLSLCEKCPIIAVPIPSVEPEKAIYIRLLVVDRVPSDRIVHLINYVSVDELRWYAGRPNVYLSTCAPVMLGLNGEDILETETDITKLDCTSFDGKVQLDKWAIVCRNIALLRKNIS